MYQLNEQGQWKPSRYGSISWTDREARYSQSKLELYGVYRTLKSLCLHLVGLPTFDLEVNKKYVKGMLSNLDIQPSNIINCWIAGILLFNFNLIHVPGRLHMKQDGLSRRQSMPDNEEELQDDWVDQVLGLGVWVNSWVVAQTLEKTGSALPHFQWNINYPAREQVFTKNALVEANPFLCFSLKSDPNTIVNLDIPHSKADTHVDLELPFIQEFLMTTCKLDDKDEAALKRFLRCAARFFVHSSQLWHQGPSQLHQLVIFPLKEQLSLILQAHDKLGHKGFYSTHRTLTDHFLWPGIDHDIAWFIKTCHKCQIRSTQHVHIPPVVATPAPLFHQVHINTMHMPKIAGLSYILQGHCSLISYLEFWMLAKETGVVVGKLCLRTCCVNGVWWRKLWWTTVHQ